MKRHLRTVPMSLTLLRLLLEEDLCIDVSSVARELILFDLRAHEG